MKSELVMVRRISFYQKPMFWRGRFINWFRIYVRQTVSQANRRKTKSKKRSF